MINDTLNNKEQLWRNLRYLQNSFLRFYVDCSYFHECTMSTILIYLFVNIMDRIFEWLSENYD